MAKKGKIHQYAGTYARIEAAIQDLPEEFLIKDLRRALPGLDYYNVVKDFIFRMTRRGYLKRISYGRYKKIFAPTIQITKNLPHSFVAEKVFAVLLKAKAENKFLEVLEITMDAEEMARNGINLFEAASFCVRSWYKSGHLERRGFGVRNSPYIYRLIDRITERPVIK